MLALHQPVSILSRRHAPSWLLLAFAAGGVNAAAFVACQRFVTHVTGTATRIGLDGGDWLLVGEYALVLGCFIAGAIAAALLIDGRYHRGRRPLYVLPLAGVSVVLAGVAIAGHAGLFGAFGGDVEQGADFALLCLLGFAMGLQNAAVTTSTGAAVRTTHLTGPATDLGIHLATALTARGETRAMAARHAALRAGKLLSFIAGAAAMVPLATRWGFLAFFAPAVIVLTATLLSIVPVAARRTASAGAAMAT